MFNNYIGNIMLTLHHLQNSRSFRILWLLEELVWAYDLNYQLITHERTSSHLAPDVLQDIHPMGKAPILVDDGRALIESGFIIEYVLKKYDSQNQFKPTDEQGWQDYTFWLHFAESSMMPPLVMRLVMTAVATKSPWFIRPIARKIAQTVENLVIKNNVTRSFKLLDDTLAKSAYVAGDTFSGADIQVYFGAKALASRGKLPDCPNIERWLKALEGRLAYKSACQKGGNLFENQSK